MTVSEEMTQMGNEGGFLGCVRKWIFFGCLISINFLAATANENVPIRTTAEVRGLDPEVAAKGLPVELEVQVTHIGSISGGGLFVHDGGSGLFVFYGEAEIPDDMRHGSLVRIAGSTVAGEFLPSVVADAVEVIGAGADPLFEPLKLENLGNPMLACELRKIQGWITRIHPEVEGKVIRVEFRHGVVSLEGEVHVGTGSGINMENLEGFLYRRVEVDTVVASVFNRSRQFIRSRFLIPNLDSISVLDSSEVAHPLRVTPSRLLVSETNPHRVLEMEGVVLAADAEGFYLRVGEGRGQRVLIRSDAPALVPGNRVLARGYAFPGGVSPLLGAFEIDVLDAGKDRPRPVRLVGSFPGHSRHFDLIEIEGEVLGVQDPDDSLFLEKDAKGGSGALGGFSGRVLWCRTQDKVYRAHVPISEELERGLAKGAMVNLIGICQFKSQLNHGGFGIPQDFMLEVVHADDITVIDRAPWLTAEVLGKALLGLLVLAVVLVCYNLMLRRHVFKQSRVIVDQVRERSVLEERHRIARELHDTQDQALAGLSHLLNNCKIQLKESGSQEPRSMELARSMLKHCQKESRASIHDLRRSLTGDQDLLQMIEESVKWVRESSDVEIRCESEGTGQTIPFRHKRHLLRIAMEAVNNGVRHASAELITVSIRHLDDGGVELEVADDGCGFPAEDFSRSGRFGLLGMQERSNRIGAEFEVVSVEGEGTKISVRMPSAAIEEESSAV